MADVDATNLDKDDDAPDPAQGPENYITPEGLEPLGIESDHLSRNGRSKVVEDVSWAVGNGDRSEKGDYLYGKKRLREINRRMRHLMKRMKIAVVVDRAEQTNRGHVFFGATVTYAKSGGENAQSASTKFATIMEKLAGFPPWPGRF
jgi:transcription elongation factor GreB